MDGMNDQSLRAELDATKRELAEKTKEVESLKLDLQEGRAHADVLAVELEEVKHEVDELVTMVVEKMEKLNEDMAEVETMKNKHAVQMKQKGVSWKEDEIRENAAPNITINDEAGIPILPAPVQEEKEAEKEKQDDDCLLKQLGRALERGDTAEEHLQRAEVSCHARALCDV